MKDDDYHMRLCGSTQVYCCGDCETCTKGQYLVSNCTEQLKEGAENGTAQA